MCSCVSVIAVVEFPKVRPDAVELAPRVQCVALEGRVQELRPRVTPVDGPEVGGEVVGGRVPHTGRAFGGMMLGMSSLYLFDQESEGATKMYATVMALFSPILLKCISDGEPAFKKKMWIAQAFMHLPFTALMLYKAFK